MPTHSINREEHLLFSRLAEGDEGAYTRIFHLYTPRLYPYILKITKDEQLARELLQETFVRLWIKRADLAEVEQPASWLFKIAANICLGWLRTAANQHRLQLLTAEKPGAGIPTASEQLEGKDLDRVIKEAVRALPPKRQEIYRLSREQGFTHQQIADQLGLSLSTVKNQIGKALRFIQEYIHLELGIAIATLAFL